MNSPKSHLSAPIGVFLLIVAVRIYVIVASGFHGYDNVFITYRFAEHLAAGSGFVYNIGERVLGVETPLYTLLLALFAWLHLPLPVVSQALGVCAAGLIGALLLFYSRRIVVGSACLVAPILYAFWPDAINSDISGSESALFSLAVLAFFYALMTARYRAGIVIGSLAVLLRPEGVLLVGLFFVFKYTIRLRSFKKDYLPDLVVLGAFVLPWLIFATAYFGSPIPNSIIAKSALIEGSSQVEPGGAFDFIAQLLNLYSPLSWVALSGAIWGVTYSLMRIYWGWLEALFFGALIGVFYFSEMGFMLWLKDPLTLMIILFLGIGAGGAYTIARSISKSKGLPLIGAIVALIALIPVAGNSFSQMLRDNTFAEPSYETESRRIAEFLAHLENVSDEKPVIIAEGIGFIGYYYRGIVVDRWGLVSPPVIDRNRSGDYLGLLEDVLEKYPAHWLLLDLNSILNQRIIVSGILESRYQIESDFASGDSPDYLLYRAKPLPK